LEKSRRLAKTATVIKYDDSYETVISWGLSALAKKPIKKRRGVIQTSSKPIEWFKLHLSGSESEERLFLPDGLDYKKVIKDYLEK